MARLRLDIPRPRSRSVPDAPGRAPRRARGRLPVRRGALVAGLCALAATNALPAAAKSSSCPGVRAVPGQASAQTLMQATLCLLNTQRTRHGLRPLRLDGAVTSAARGYAQTMVRQQFISHFSRGTGPAQRIARSGYRCHRPGCPRGENIAWAPTDATPERMVALWMHSAGHRYNILYRGYAVIGLGVVPGRGSSSAGMYVADFAGA